ncbi:MotE family protein [Brevibacillus composti]|uniref:MotE family protein n=1 Tax=Brevibacillus composti TaxID=2796470 RepID=A0A7T5EP23_9BACL|nr:MotE family protein [Brevibacillus composti]QQE76132.1 MotE family protein [Brevibacillus composti]QUO43161.1 MotE family protein [Brevibacillus composti]
MEEIQEEREYSRWEWLFYMIIIPALFATLLGGVFLSFLGVNVLGHVLGWANTVPYVEKLIPDDYAASSGEDKEANTEKQLQGLQEEQTKNQQTIASLTQEAEKKDSAIQALEKQVSDLQKLIEDKRTTEEERQKQYQELAKLYSTMSPKNAAAIVENLSLEEAVTVLKKMKADQQAGILAKMDPKKAADISILLKDSVVNKDDDIAALQERVQVLTKALSETRKDSSNIDALINTFSQMPAEDAAAIIRSLMGTNQNRAISILAGMSDDKRASILAAVVKEDTEKKENVAAKITSELLR